MTGRIVNLQTCARGVRHVEHVNELAQSGGVDVFQLREVQHDPPLTSA